MKVFKSVLAAFLVLICLSAKAQDNYKFHSVYMYTFSKYIQWPSGYQSGDFVIGVLGDSPVIEHLEKLAQERTVGSQKLVITKFSSTEAISKCHMLFIPDHQSGELEKVLTKLEGRSTLIISETPGLAKKGSSINFVLVDGKWKFELNKASTEKLNLKVSAELTRLALPI